MRTSDVFTARKNSWWSITLIRNDWMWKWCECWFTVANLPGLTGSWIGDDYLLKWSPFLSAVVNLSPEALADWSVRLSDVFWCWFLFIKDKSMLDVDLMGSFMKADRKSRLVHVCFVDYYFLWFWGMCWFLMMRITSICQLFASVYCLLLTLRSFGNSRRTSSLAWKIGEICVTFVE